MSAGAATDPDADGERPGTPRALAFVPALLAGWAIIGFGAWSALRNSREAHPFALLVHIISFDLVHDLLIGPVLLFGGWLLGRVLPVVARGPGRAAAAATVLCVVFAYPLIRRWGQRPTNSSTLPLPYGRNVWIVIGIVWGCAAATIAWRVVTARRAPESVQPSVAKSPDAG